LLAKLDFCSFSIKYLGQLKEGGKSVVIEVFLTVTLIVSTAIFLFDELQL